MTKELKLFAATIALMVSGCVDEQISPAFTGGNVVTFRDESGLPTGEYMVQLYNQDLADLDSTVFAGFDFILSSAGDGVLMEGEYNWTGACDPGNLIPFQILSIARHVGGIEDCGADAQFERFQNIDSATMQIAIDDEEGTLIDPIYSISYTVSDKSGRYSANYRGTLRRVEYVGLRPMF